MKYFVVICFFGFGASFLLFIFLIFSLFIHSFILFLSFHLRAAVLLFFLNTTSLLVITLLFLLVSCVFRSFFLVQFLASRFARDGRRGARGWWW